jgi:hypothetical protein
VRSSYHSQWQVWSDSTQPVAGRYYRVRHDDRGVPTVPAYPGPTPFGSREWWDKNFILQQPPIGEVLTARHGWDTGAPPVPVPFAHTVGDPLCIENGESTSAGLSITNPARRGGFPALCFVPSPLEDFGWAAEIYRCEVQAWWIDRIAELEQLFIGTLTAVLRQRFAGATVTHFGGTRFFPPCTTVVHQEYCIAVVAATNDMEQALIQVIEGVLSPTDMGGIGTTNLWYTRAQRVLDALATQGVGRTQPMLLIGYSYGGATVQVAAGITRLANPNRFIRWFTIGAPRPGDQRLVDLLALPTRGCALANDNDLITTIPPDLDSILPVQVILGVDLLNFNRWRPPLETWRQAPDGQVFPNAHPVTSSQEIADLILHVWNTHSFYGYPAHNFAEYRRRIRLRCPRAPAVADGILGLQFAGNILAGGVLGLRGYSTATGKVGIWAPRVARGYLGLSGVRVAYARLGLGTRATPQAKLALVGYPLPAGLLGLSQPALSVGRLGLLSPSVATGKVGVGPPKALPAGSLGIGTKIYPAGRVGFGPRGLPVGTLGLRALQVPAGELGLHAPAVAAGALGVAGLPLSTGRLGLAGFSLSIGHVALRGFELATGTLGFKALRVSRGIVALSTRGLQKGGLAMGVRGLPSAKIGLGHRSIPSARLGLKPVSLIPGGLGFQGLAVPEGTLGLGAAAGAGDVARGSLGLQAAAFTPPSVAWSDSFTDTTGTDITMHVPNVGTGGYHYAYNNDGSYQIVSDSLQAQAFLSVVYFAPGAAARLTTTVDLAFLAPGDSVVYWLRWANALASGVGIAVLWTGVGVTYSVQAYLNSSGTITPNGTAQPVALLGSFPRLLTVTTDGTTVSGTLGGVTATGGDSAGMYGFTQQAIMDYHFAGAAWTNLNCTSP